MLVSGAHQQLKNFFINYCQEGAGNNTIVAFWEGLKIQCLSTLVAEMTIAKFPRSFFLIVHRLLMLTIELPMQLLLFHISVLVFSPQVRCKCWRTSSGKMWIVKKMLQRGKVLRCIKCHLSVQDEGFVR